MSEIKNQEDVTFALSRERKLVEALSNAAAVGRGPMTVPQIAAYANQPVSSTYKSVAVLKSIGVLIEGSTVEVTDTGRNARRATYVLDRERANNYAAPLNVVGELPKYYNHVSRQLYTLLDFAARYDPDSPSTGGVKAAASYLEVATLLLHLALSPEGADSVDNLKQQLLLRTYLQQALPAVENVQSQIRQMLDDPRLWSKELYVLKANTEVLQNEELINRNASRINL